MKCPACGWVHAEISESEALDAGGVEQYLHCWRCGADSAGFVLAVEGDAPEGCTLQPVVVRGRD